MGRPDGVGTPRAPLVVGGDPLDRGQVRHFARDAAQGERPRSSTDCGLTSDGHERLQALERENRELRRANEILKSASAFLASMPEASPVSSSPSPTPPRAVQTPAAVRSVRPASTGRCTSDQGTNRGT
jgi:hypothetical protein